MKNWSHDKIKFYKYYFIGVDKPIIMEAINRDMADEMLSLLPERTGVPINLELLTEVKIEIPLTGKSTKVREGQVYIWVGEDKTANGWMLEDEFKKLI
jgi:hypothetical protein